MKKIFVFVLTLFLCANNVYAEEDYMAKAVHDGIIVGGENGDLRGNVNATRAEFAQMAVKFLDIDGGVNVFSDVSDEDWFCESISAAAAHGILSGYEDGCVRPYDIVTCEDAIAVLGRYYEAESDENMQNGVSAYAKKYYAYAAKNELFTSWRFGNPQNAVTRKDVVSLLYKYRENDEKRLKFESVKISETGVFNTITLELETNMPCVVYYGMAETGAPDAEPNIPLCFAAGGAPVTVSVAANINKSCDITLCAVTNTEKSRRAVVKNVAAFAFSVGDGTEESPYIIYTRQQLEQTAYYSDRIFRLGNDIYLDGEWVPIETFSGTLDGNGHKISGIRINTNEENAGLFRTLKGCVKNLTAEGEVTAKRNAGIIAGVNEGVLEACAAEGKVTARMANGGGICGTNRGKVTGCLSAVSTVKSGTYAGGIAGLNYSEISVCLTACEEISADMYAGGIAGSNTGGRIEKCAAANMTVFSSMTKNGGRIAANREGGVTADNYAFDRTDTNSVGETESRYSQNGIDTAWEKIVNLSFYTEIDGAWQSWTSADNGFRLIYPRTCKPPELTAGESAFMPKVINDADALAEIGKNPSGHYILGGDIHMKLPWKTICGLVGFSGTFDGGGYTIYGLEIKGGSGFLSNISGGTVRNVNFADVKAVFNESGAVIAACNYGYIENCGVSGSIYAQKTGSAGGIAGQNNGTVSNCTVNCNIIVANDNIVVGGICVDNCGVIIGCTYSGKIDVRGKSAAVGGICGYSAGGYILECFAETYATIEDADAYVGAICGIASSAQIYKCVSDGMITADGTAVYAGGICAAAEECAVYNCASSVYVSIPTEKSYAGGICGYVTGGNVQNTYSAAEITAEVSGGICGYAENAFIMQNVSLCTQISGASAGAVAGRAELCEVSDNYCCDRMKINSHTVTDGENNGILRTLTALKDMNFYFKPIENGGLLGWSNKIYGGSVWTSVRGYAFPVLTGVNGRPREPKFN